MILPRDKLLAALTALADSGLPMQTNTALAGPVGVTHDAINHLLTRLVATNAIRIDYKPDGRSRRVVILDSGARTAWQAAAPFHGVKARGPKLGQRAPGWGFQIMSDASLYGSHADDVREARRRGYEVVKAVTPGWFRVAGTEVPPETLREIAAGRARP